MVVRAAAYDRFEAKVQAAGDCLLWTGAKNSDGYGVTRDFTGSLVLAHRFHYMMKVAAIPAGLVLRHACDTRLCVAPWHLTPGTHTENLMDAYERGRRPSWRTARELADLDRMFAGAVAG